jgi:hypothetical protein
MYAEPKQNDRAGIIQPSTAWPRWELCVTPKQNDRAWIILPTTAWPHWELNVCKTQAERQGTNNSTNYCVATLGAKCMQSTQKTNRTTGHGYLIQPTAAWLPLDLNVCKTFAEKQGTDNSTNHCVTSNYCVTTLGAKCMQNPSIMTEHG